MFRYAVSKPGLTWGGGGGEGALARIFFVIQYSNDMKKIRGCFDTILESIFKL